MSNITKNQNGTYPIPAVASFFIPGLGQLIKGHSTKAVMFFAIWVLWFIVSFFISWIPLIGWIAGPLLYLINIGDALLSDKDNKIPN